jgi:hypothetical protein
MNITGEKIEKLIEIYGIKKGYAEKSYLPMFCQDFNLNYTQWNAYTRGKQNIGTKIIDLLIDIFPELNLNWLIKDDVNVFIGNDSVPVIQELAPKPAKKIEQQDIYDKLDDILIELKKVTSKEG